MKRKCILFLMAICIFNSAFCQKLAFQPGENIQYCVSYALGFVGVKAAQANITVNKCTYNDEEALKVELAAKTIKAFKSFNIRDTMRTIMNAQTLEPYFSQQQTHEDDYYSSVQTTYSYNEGKPQVEVKKYKKSGLKRDSTMTFSKNFYDVIHILCEIRNEDASKLVLNKKVPMPFLFAYDTYDLYWRYTGKERIKLKNGETYDCIKICPNMVEGSLFGKGDVMTIWLTDDENHIPVQIEAKLKLGKISAYAEFIKGNKYPLKSKVVEKK